MLLYVIIGLALMCICCTGLLVGKVLDELGHTPSPEPRHKAKAEQPDVWEGFQEARRKHPLPAAHSELEALEVDGPVFVKRPEVIVRAGR